MDLEIIRREAFTIPVHNPANPRPPFRFVDCEYFIITYETDPNALRAIVPEPLMPENNLVHYEFIRMPDSSGFGDYRDSGQVVSVRDPQGRLGAYTHSMYLDDEGPTAGGCEIWGFPKTLARPVLSVDGNDTLLATLDYGTRRMATGAAGYKHHVLNCEDERRKLASVVIADLDLANASKVADSIVAEGGKALAVAMDVTNEEAVNAGMEEATKVFDGIDVLVSNAGIQIVSPVDEFAFSERKKMLATHRDGAFLKTTAALKHMYASGKGGSIVGMGSVHSYEASKFKAAYAIAKHGLLGLARVVAKEGGSRGLRANVVCPGFIRTPLVDKRIAEQAKALGVSEQEVVENVVLKDTVDGEFTSLDDVSNTVAFLAGLESNALMGQSVLVTHGWSMY